MKGGVSDDHTPLASELERENLTRANPPPTGKRRPEVHLAHHVRGHVLRL